MHVGVNVLHFESKAEAIESTGKEREKRRKRGKRGIREWGQRRKRRKNTLKEGERGKIFLFYIILKEIA